MEDLSGFCCQNPRCPVNGTRGGGNLSVCGHIDKAKAIRQLYCRVCKARFSERKGTVYYRGRLGRQEVDSILRHVQDGNGMRQTGRLTGHKEDTVIRYARKAGAHARAMHRELLAVSPSDPRGATGREVGLRRQEAEALRLGEGRRPPQGRLLGPRGL